MPRATPMSPDDRRVALIAAALPLVAQHGRQVTTRQIAEAAGIAEGTIFRVFDSKDDLIDAAVEKAFEPGTLLEDIAAIELDQPLRDRLVALVTLLQTRFSQVFGVMRAVGLVTPPDRVAQTARQAQRAQKLLAAMIEVVRPDQASFTMPAAGVVQTLRLLTFSGSHPEISGGELLTPEQIVDTVLYGAVKRSGADGS